MRACPSTSSMYKRRTGFVVPLNRPAALESSSNTCIHNSVSSRDSGAATLLELQLPQAQPAGPPVCSAGSCDEAAKENTPAPTSTQSVLSLPPLKRCKAFVPPGRAGGTGTCAAVALEGGAAAATVPPAPPDRQQPMHTQQHPRTLSVLYTKSAKFKVCMASALDLCVLRDTHPTAATLCRTASPHQHTQHNRGCLMGAY